MPMPCETPGGGVGDGGVGLGGGGVVDGAVGDAAGQAIGADDGGGLVEIAGEDLVVAVRADVADGEGGVRGDLLLDLEGVGEERGGGDVGLDGGGRDRPACR